MRAHLLLSVFCISLITTATAQASIVAGQIDDFESGTTLGWEEGLPINPPTNEPTGGPAGAGDNFLSNISSGLLGTPGGKMVMYNRAQWTGDFLAAGVVTVEADVANFGAEPLYVRLGIQGGFGDRYCSTISAVIPADGQWHSVSFGLSAADLTLTGGSATLDAVLANVTEFRILSAQAAPSFFGDEIDGHMGVDNILATPEPSSLALLAVAAGLALRRRRFA